MPIELRQYQLSLVDRVLRDYESGARRICVVSPTGSGKTLVAAELIKRFVSRGLKVMFQVHLDCLIGQTRSKLWDMGYRDSNHIGFIKAKLPEKPHASLQIASQQTLLRRDWWKSRQFDVIFFDECHTTAFVKAAVVVYSNGSKFKRVKLCSVPNVVAIDTSRMDARITVNNGISAKTANVSMLRGLNIGIFRQRPGKWSISSY